MNVWEISQKVSIWYDTVPGGRLTIALVMLLVICLFIIASSRLERLKERKERRIKQQRIKALFDFDRQVRGGVTTWHV